MRTLAIAVPIVFFMAAPVVADPGHAEQRAAIEAVMRKMEAATVAADAKAYVAMMDPTDDVFYTEQFNMAKDWARIKPESFVLSIVDKKELPGKATPEAADKAPSDKAPSEKTPADKPSAEKAPADKSPAGADKPASGEGAAPAKRPARDRSWVDVGAPIEPLFEESRAEFRMQMTWKMAGWEKTRTLTMPVVFNKDKAGVWRFAGEKWETVSAPAAGSFNGVRVLFEPGNKKHRELAEAIVAGIPEIRSAVDAHFKMHTPGEVTIKLFQSMQHLQASIWLSYTDSLGGWNEPKESMKILVRDTYEGMKKTIAHEYGHCVTFHMGPKATDAPWWVLEGSADFAAAAFRPNAAALRDRTVRNWAKKKDGLADWDKIEKFPIPDEFKHYMRNVYTQGEHMMAFIDTRYGTEARIAFLRSLFSGKTTDQASREGLGLPFADVDSAWRLSVQQQLDTEPKDDK